MNALEGRPYKRIRELYEAEEAARRDHRFVAHWEQHRRKVLIYLSPFWSEAFRNRTKGEMNPIDFAQLRSLPGANNELTYVHIDYAASHNGKTELRTSTLLGPTRSPRRVAT